MGKISDNGLRPKRRHAVVWGSIVALVAITTLPMAGYLATGISQAQESTDQASADVNPRSEELWREVRDGTAGYSAVTGPGANVLIQNGGENWRQVRNNVVAVVGAWVIALALLALALLHVTTGGAKLEKPPSGVKVDRWRMVDRVVHWYTALLFFVLGVTGLSLLWGKNVLIPVMGPEGFAAWANIAKPLHDYLALFFIAGLVVMLLMWLKHNMFKRHDLEWIKQGGGFLKGRHPPAGYCNAGEKMFFWTLMVFGVVMIVSGFFPLFPNYGFTRETMQLANIVHGASSILVIAVVCMHVYLGTLGSEGALTGMLTGKVDKHWAQQHHGQWYREVMAEQSTSNAGGAAPEAAPAARAP